MWGLRSPTPRGRTESCTLRILTDAFTGAHGSGFATVDYGLRPVDFPTLRTRAHISVADASVD